MHSNNDEKKAFLSAVRANDRAVVCEFINQAIAANSDETALNNERHISPSRPNRSISVDYVKDGIYECINEHISSGMFSLLLNAYLRIEESSESRVRQLNFFLTRAISKQQIEMVNLLLAVQETNPNGDGIYEQPLKIAYHHKNYQIFCALLNHPKINVNKMRPWINSSVDVTILTQIMYYSGGTV